MATNKNSASGGGGCTPFPTAAADPSSDVNWTQAQPPTFEPPTAPSPAATPLSLVGVSLTIPDSAVGKAWRPGMLKCKPPKEAGKEKDGENESESEPEDKKRAPNNDAMKFDLAEAHKRDASIRGTSLSVYPEGDDDEDYSLPAADLKQLLLGDTTGQAMPVHLRMLLQQTIGGADDDLPAMTPAELLFLLVFAAALEGGFMPKDNAEYGSYMSLSSISSYNSQNVRRFSARRPKYTSDERKSRFSIGLRTLVDIVQTHDEQAQLLESILSGVVTGDLLIVTLTPDPATNHCGHSVCLSVPRYVHSSQPRDKPLQQRFQKLDELALKLREALFVPLRNQQMLLLGQHRFPALEGLPEELYDEVFRYLSDNQLNTVANVCRCLRDEARRSIERRCAGSAADVASCPC